MSTTLRWLIEGSSLENLRCVACSDQLDTPITNVNVLDNLDVVKWIKPNELVLSSGYLFLEDEQLQRQLIRDLRQVNCAALGVKSRRFFQTIPEGMIQEASKVGLPLIELPFFYSFSDISRTVYGHLFNQNTYRTRREQKLLLAMTGPLFAGGSVRDMLSCIAQQYRTAVLLVNRKGVLLEMFHFPGAELDPPDRFQHFSMPDAGDVVPLPMAERKQLFLCVPLQGGYGSLFLLETPSRSLRGELMVLQHAAALLSLKLEQRRFQRISSEQGRSSFMNLLTTDTGEMSEEEILHICESSRFDCQRKRICGALFPRGKMNRMEMESAAEKLRKCARDFCQRTELDLTFFLCRDERQICLFLLGKPSVSNPELTRLARELLGSFWEQEGEEAAKQLVAGVGRCQQEISALPGSLEECRKLTQLMSRVFPERSIFTAPEITAYRLLEQLPPEELRQIYLDTVAVLAQFDRANHSELLQTLTAFFACQFNAVQAAKELYIHRNTMLHRLEKIKEILHCDMTDMDEIMSLYLGLCIFKMLN